MKLRVRSKTDTILGGLTLLTLLSVCLALVWVFFRAPQDAVMGPVQRIFYFHVASAYAMYLGAIACLIGSVWYLKARTLRADALGYAGAQVAVLFGAIVLVTGPLWALKAWGHYWTWDPRLTTSLLTVLIYAGYLVLRRYSQHTEFTRKFAASIGVIGALNLPLIHLSVRKWSGQHPQVITPGGGGLHHPDMSIAFALSMLAFTLLAITLVTARTRLLIAQAHVRQLELRIELQMVELAHDMGNKLQHSDSPADKGNDDANEGA